MVFSRNQRTAFLQPATNVFVAGQVDRARWKTGNIDQNLQRNNVARQVEGFCISHFAALRTFAPIVSAHPYCVRKSTCHVMHRARALSSKTNNDRAIPIALIGFNDLGRSVTPTFLFRNRFYLQFSTLCPKTNKNQCGKLNKIQDFCPRDMKSCHLAAARLVKLWSLNAILFFDEPRQLTKFA